MCAVCRLCPKFYFPEPRLCSFTHFVIVDDEQDLMLSSCPVVSSLTMSETSCCHVLLSNDIKRRSVSRSSVYFLAFFFYIFSLFRVADEAGYPSAFYCTLNTHYRIVSYRIVSVVDPEIQIGWESPLLP